MRQQYNVLIVVIGVIAGIIIILRDVGLPLRYYAFPLAIVAVILLLYVCVGILRQHPRARHDDRTNDQAKGRGRR